MPDNSWRPDWKDWTQYPKPDEINDLQFGWELLRRNTEYQELYDQYVDSMRSWSNDRTLDSSGDAFKINMMITTRFCLREPVDYRQQFATESELKVLAGNIEYVWPLEVSDVKMETSIPVPPKVRGIGAVAVFLPVCWDKAGQTKQIEALEKELDTIRDERKNYLEKIAQGLESDQATNFKKHGVDTLLAEVDESQLTDSESGVLRWADLSYIPTEADNKQGKRWRLFLRRLDATEGDYSFANALLSIKGDPDAKFFERQINPELDLSGQIDERAKSAAASVRRTAKKHSEKWFANFLRKGTSSILGG